MTSSPMLTPSSFPARSVGFSDRVEHRRAVTDRDKDLVYRTRYLAYSRQSLIKPRADRRVFDETYDVSSNHYNIMTYVGGEFVSAVRIHVGSEDCDTLPSLALFGDVLSPFLNAGSIIVDPTRIVAEAEKANKLPELPYLTIRAAWIAAEHFGADMITSTCIRDHQAFYNRVFGFETLSSPRPYPQMSRAMVCMGLNFQASKKRVESQYPIFRSTAAERRAIFGACPS